MKNNILKLCTLFTLIIGTLFAQDVPVDSTIAGRAFARNLWDRYFFYGHFTADNTERNFSGVMNLRGYITSFQVDGVAIVSDGDTPLPGLPYVASGTITNFWLSMDAKAGDDHVAWGYANTPRLPEGQSVIIMLHPEDERGFAEYKTSGLVRPLLVDEQGNEVGYYNFDNQGFHYYLNPLDGPIAAYVVVNNRRVASIWLDPFDSAETMDNNVVNVELIGGVSRVVMNDYGYYNQSSITDGQTEVEGEMVPAKVFLLDTEVDQCHITVRTEDDIEVSVKVYDVDGNRFDLLADLSPWETEYGATYWETQIPKGYGKILIVVTSLDGDTKPFRAFFSKGGAKG